ncbi:MAG: NHLP bacteriocin system secretion protein [Acidobacteriota bacterium]
MATDGSKIFRKVALERLSSPEQLDQLMQVTSPRGWIALAAMIALLLLAVGWGIFGSIPTSAQGEGILIRRGGVATVVATGSGQVQEMLVKVGDEVRKGDVVARVRQEGMERQIADAEARLAAGEQELEDLVRYAEEQKRLSAANEAQQRANFERTIATLERQLELLGQNLEVQKELLADGLVTQQTLLASEQEVNQVRDRLAEQRLQLAGLELTRLETEQQLDLQLEGERTQQRDLLLELRELQASLQESVRVEATEDGRVIELVTGRGDVVAPGTPILTMEVLSEELIAVVFVPAGEGKQVSAGMEARITPSTVRPEEYGFILGEVTWVSEFPATAQGMQRLLANQELVTSLMEQGSPIQVDLRLKEDAATPTGFRWSSSTGPDLEISSGTLATGGIILRRDRPLSLVIPKLREKLGV